MLVAVTFCFVAVPVSATIGLLCLAAAAFAFSLVEQPQRRFLSVISADLAIDVRILSTLCWSNWLRPVAHLS